MLTFILWVGFIGAWLLFAGSIYQAVLELQDEDIRLDRIRAAGAKAKKPKQVSAWWWIVFPIKIYLEFLRRRAFERHIMELLTPEDIESLASLRSKATAWWFVAVGGFCLALKETYELGHHLGWNGVVIIVVAIGMFVLSIINLAVMSKRNKAIPRN